MDEENVCEKLENRTHLKLAHCNRLCQKQVITSHESLDFRCQSWISSFIQCDLNEHRGYEGIQTLNLGKTFTRILAAVSLDCVIFLEYSVGESTVDALHLVGRRIRLLFGGWKWHPKLWVRSEFTAYKIDRAANPERAFLSTLSALFSSTNRDNSLKVDAFIVNRECGSFRVGTLAVPNCKIAAVLPFRNRWKP